MSVNYSESKEFFQKHYLDSNSTGRVGKQEELRTTPLFSLAVKYATDAADAAAASSLLPVSNKSTSHKGTFRVPSTTDSDSSSSDGTLSTSSSSDSLSSDSSSQHSSAMSTEQSPHGTNTALLPQYGLLGFHIGNESAIEKGEPIFLNVNAPNSAFICGSQGSGKSYTLSCMLENCLLKKQDTGPVSEPVAGVVFHYDVDSSNSLAEAAQLCSRGIKVNVLVSQSNERVLRPRYEQLAKKYGNLTVQPLLLRSRDLSIERMNKLMALADKEGPVPLYMEVVQRILREMAIRGSTIFDYRAFRATLAAEVFTRDQNGPLALRLGLLESFMHPDDKPGTLTRSEESMKSLLEVQPGTLTIIDLSDTFIDASTVCLLFDICLSLIKKKRPVSGLVVALDEAHKFMNKSAAADSFTERLLTTVREQRHNATRVIVATQEPTISEKLLDLCSMSIVHRFASPAWFASIRDHLGGASKMISSSEGQCEMFEEITELNVGESLVFCPSAFVGMGEDGQARKLGPVAMKMKTRTRLGRDGGVSILASDVGKMSVV